MRFVGLSLAGLVGFLVLAAAGGTLLPAESPVADTIATLEASPSELFPLFNSRAGQRRVWARSGMSLASLGGPDEGMGSRTCFCGIGIRGEGVVVESDVNRRVAYHIDFGFIAVRRVITLEAVGTDATHVVWTETLVAPNALMRWVLLGSSAIPGFHAVLDAAEAAAREDRSARVG